MQNPSRIFIVCFLPIIFACSITLAAQTEIEVGVTEHEILIGQSCPMSGPSAALGQELNAGATAYFDFINARGGVHGRKINLITYDDRYSPVLSRDNTIKLIEKDKVFLLFGFIGTPTSQAVVFYLKSSRYQIPFFTPFTGARFLREPVTPWIINVRASYDDETSRMINHFVSDLGLSKISVLYQNDAYGKTVLEGVVKALRKRGLKLASKGSYQRNTIEVVQAMKSIAVGKPQVIIMGGAYKPCAEFIKQYKKIIGAPKFANVSFVGADALRMELKKKGDGVYISQVVPFPYDNQSKVVQKCTQIMNRRPTFVELEGCIDAIFLVKALELAGKKLTREGLIKTIEKKGEIKIEELTLKFSEFDHQGMDDVFFTKIKDNDFIKINSF